MSVIGTLQSPFWMLMGCNSFILTIVNRRNILQSTVVYYYLDMGLLLSIHSPSFSI